MNATLLIRRIRRAFQDDKNTYAIGEALGIVSGLVLEVAHATDKKLDEMERGRQALIFLSIHKAISDLAESFMEKGASDSPPAKPPARLRLTHLQE